MLKSGTHKIAVMATAAYISLTIAAQIPARAVTLTPNSTSDEQDANPGDGTCATILGICTLRAAMEESNALAGRDVIEIPSGIFELTNSLGGFTITDSVGIIGTGANNTIVDGGNRFINGLFINNLGTNPIVNIFGVTIRNFNEGGIFVSERASLSLSESIVTQNSSLTGGGIANNGFIQLFDSTISNNGEDGSTARGGGIANSTLGVIELVGSTVSGNAATGGAGINNSGRLSMTNSTISGNKAGRGGGGIQNTGIANISYSTITNNIANNRRDLDNTDAFGGGIKNVGGTVNLGNTILAGNTDNRDLSFDNLAAPDCSGLITSFRGNLIGINKNCIINDTIYGSDISFDQVGIAASPIDPRLGLLANNGGFTQTHALLAGSPAIDQGTGITSASFFDSPSTDQRGITRPLDGDGDGIAASDVGSYEVQVPVPEPASTLGFLGFGVLLGASKLKRKRLFVKKS